MPVQYSRKYRMLLIREPLKNSTALSRTVRMLPRRKLGSKSRFYKFPARRLHFQFRVDVQPPFRLPRMHALLFCHLLLLSTCRFIAAQLLLQCLRTPPLLPFVNVVCTSHFSAFHVIRTKRLGRGRKSKALTRKIKLSVMPTTMRVEKLQQNPALQ